MPSARRFRRRAFQCGLYEAQDVLLEMADADLLCLEPGPAHRVLERWQRRLLYHDISRQLVFVNPGLRRVRVVGEYDLFVAVCQNYWDLLSINAIDGWKDRCRTSVCWLDEMWVVDLPQTKYWLHALNQFDHVFIGCEGSVDAVSRLIGRQCHWIGGGVDAIRFSPYPRPPSRVIDVQNIGRISEGVHKALRRAASEDGLFYLYDTVHGSDLEPFDHRDHRQALANVAKRSRFFMVAPGKANMASETGGQAEIGYRYYEGCAAGTIMIGQAPDCRSFRERFDWRDAVVEVRPDGSDVVECLHELKRDPGRLNAISRRNASEALLRHDWLYRWKRVLDVAGVPAPPGVAKREDRLKQLARLATEPYGPTIATSRQGPIALR